MREPKTEPNYYETLGVSPSASSAEIKQAYRRLVKQYHPDLNQNRAAADKMVRINAAYEVLGDSQQRRSYDSRRFGDRGVKSPPSSRSRPHSPSQDADEQLTLWLKKVYTPINRLIYRILKPLNRQIDELSADPFDDELMETFQAYLEDCRQDLQQAQKLFRSMANPAGAAGVAMHLYYCLNQVTDGLEELQLFTFNYDDHHLHTGQELFRIAKGLRQEAQQAVKALPI